MGKYLNVREAAQYIGRSEKALRRLEEKGRIRRADCPDDRVQFDPTELDRFMSAERGRTRPLRSLDSFVQSA